MGGAGNVGAENAELDRLRRQIAAMTGRPDRRAVGVADRSTDMLPVPEALADLLPQRGIARGSVVTVSGARSILLSVIASVSASGAQVGVVGLPALNFGSVEELGGDLSRIATVPDPGVDPVEVAGVLLDGLDLVVLGLDGITVPPSRTRVVMGRVRKQLSTLLVVAGTWPGAHLRLDAEVMAYRHLPGGAGPSDLADARVGYGRIGGMSLQVTVTDRGRRRKIGEIDFVARGFGTEARMGLVPSQSREPSLAVAN
ncbi:hypothetical protein [Gordonia rhizosphera]|uniref:Uncharacterized protein n=1 Tax=Gordonia rhizosphera NBRC 16068 TaxID=1108045 RepID=K6W797_9ACTN|nr:hypothetical protein [Gordonia rhizosphera]GAB88097.1 hypothetical protein GORHZ_002_00070 [Gordonia rhizosphera NBRC 16068]